MDSLRAQGAGPSSIGADEAEALKAASRQAEMDRDRAKQQLARFSRADAHCRAAAKVRRSNVYFARRLNSRW